MIICLCKKCSKEFNTYNSEIRRGGGIYCSRECYELSKLNPNGISHKINYCLDCGKQTSDYRYERCIPCSNTRNKKNIPVSEETKNKHRESMRNRINPSTTIEARLKLSLKALLRQGNTDRSTPAFNGLFRNYLESAKIRGYEFIISKEEFKNLTKMDCHYCGSSPSNTRKHGRLDSKYPSIYIYNGIDRVNNSIGYRIDNCVPCCTLCNKMKKANNADMFIKHAIRIAKKWGGL